MAASNIHGSTINIFDKPYDLLKKCIIPDRDSFLNTEYKQMSNRAIDANDILYFLGNDVAQCSTKKQYSLLLHGILPCGSKTTIEITGIYPYVDVRVEPHTNAQSKIRILKSNMSSIMDDSADIGHRKMYVVRGKDFMGFCPDELEYIRVEFNQMFDRSKFLKMCEAENIKTFSNDRSSYHRVVARRYEINLSGWNTIAKYKWAPNSDSLAKFTFTVDIADIKGFDPSIAMGSTIGGYPNSLFKYEQMIIASFDIEMIPFNANAFPDAGKCIKDEIFMICMTFHMVSRPEAILSVCLSLKKSDPIDDVVIIECQTEQCLLLAFSMLIHIMRPDFITEFNGGGFDWRNIMIKVERYGLLPEFLRNISLTKLSAWQASSAKWYFAERMIKVDGATAACICNSLKMDGYINFDTMIVFKQLEPKADSHKLNECLKRCNLGSKDDLDVQTMFRMYREGRPEEIKTVAHYCFIDTVKLQALVLKKNVILDRREIANLSMTCIYDAFYYANGSKIRNLLMNLGEKRNYMFDTLYKPVIEDPNAKFPGAFVVPPLKGVVRPIWSLNEWCDKYQVPDDVRATAKDMIVSHFADLRDLSKDIPEYFSSCNNESIYKYAKYLRSDEALRQYPVSGLDYSSLYPSLIMTYNISPERLITDPELADRVQANAKWLVHHVDFPFLNKQVHAWFVDTPIDTPRECGLCPTILIDLFDKRAAIKKIMKPFDKLKHKYELEMKEVGESNFEHWAEYNEACFDYGYYDSKQKALKVFMNTFYGEMGNFLSSICAVECAGSVTTMGQKNLKYAKARVEDHHKMVVHYGDTDSLYISCNASHFIDDDIAYITGQIDRLEYGTRLVSKTFDQIEIVKNDVNNYLKADNGRVYLKMAYEEVLYPVVFVSKKKYFGIPHEDSINFTPKKPFLRGLEIVKRGVSDALKSVCEKVVRDILDITKSEDMLELVEHAVKQFFITKWDPREFVKSAVYRPDKRNPSVIKMMERYKEDKYLPEPNVRFKYVICVKEQVYDPQGRKIDIKAGDRWEILERALECDYPIDLEYYFDREITGQLARFITFYSQFDEGLDDLKLGGLTEKECYTRIEDHKFKRAKKYISEIASKYSSKSRFDIQPLYKQLWKIVCDIVQEKSERISRRNGKQETRIVYHGKLSHNVKRISTIFDTEDGFVSQHQLAQAIHKYVNCAIEAIDVSRLMNYIERHGINGKFSRAITEHEWKEAIVMHIRESHGFKNNLNAVQLSDIISNDEIHRIIDTKKELYNGIVEEQAIAMINMTSEISSELY